jgi:N-methylhydantoinase A
LLAYGGAGPMHAAFVAEELEISRVVVPPSPGNFSAFGCLISDLRHDLVKTRMMETRTAPWAEVEAEFQALESEGRDGLAGDGVASGDMVFRRAAGMRYIGQSWELSVDVRPEVKSADALEAVFREAHAKRYGHAGDGPTEIVSIRVGAIGAMSKPTFPDVAPGAAPGDALIERRQVYFDDEFQDAPVYDRQRLTGPVTTPGPLLVEEMGALTVVPPGWTAAVGGLGELSLTRTKP